MKLAKVTGLAIEAKIPLPQKYQEVKPTATHLKKSSTTPPEALEN